MDKMHWLNEPPGWTEQDGALRFTVAPGTDFWRKTHNGAIRDNGHFHYRIVFGDFTARVKVTGQYNSLYDQAGLMVREDETTWLKCGIEYMNGVQHASAVVTRDYSDWSVTPLPAAPVALYLEVRRTGGTIEISYSLDGAAYAMCRTTRLTASSSLEVGPMAAAPKGPGFPVVFEEFHIQPG
jgi:regulation of enolase protein 1 (concanavalin A-like superfamily)